MASHELLAVEECPISSPLVNRGIASLWRSGRAGQVPEGVREVEFFANADDTQLLVDVGCAREARRAAVRAWAEEFRSSLPEIAGVVAFREPNPGDRKAGAPEILVAVGASYLTYHTQRAKYRVSAGSFFQTNRHLTDELVNIVTAGQSGELALDLYAGAGLFSTALAGDFHHVVSVEIVTDFLRRSCLQSVLEWRGSSGHHGAVPGPCGESRASREGFSPPSYP